jgi:hypothetical protein
MIEYDGHNLEISFEIWRFKEFLYKIINRLSLLFGRGVFWIDCGYCRREKGQIKCSAPGAVPYDKLCNKCFLDYEADKGKS